MVTFIKKRLLNGTPPASTTFSHIRQDTKEENLIQNSEIQHLDGQDVMEEAI